MGASLLVHGNYVDVAEFRAAGLFRPTQEARGDVPTLSRVGDDRNRLLVVAGEHSDHNRTTLRLKRNAITDLEFEHARVRPRLVQEPQTLDDSVVEVDELCFGEAIDVDLHRHPRV